MNDHNFNKSSKWFPIFVVVLILLLIYFALMNLPEITTGIIEFLLVISPLFYGILFAYFLYMPHLGLEKLIKKIRPRFIARHARGIATVVLFLLIVGLLAVILIFVVPIVVDSIVDLGTAIPLYVSSAIDYLNNLPEDSLLATLDIQSHIQTISTNIFLNVVNPAGIEQIASGVMNFAGGVFSAILGIVISLYILLERDRIAGFFTRLNHAIFKKESKERRVRKYFSQINEVLFTFIASKGLDSIINIICATTILLIFRVPYALLLGLIAGVFNFIPYLGSIISAIIISLITLIAVDLQTAALVALCLLVFHQIDGNYIEPRIMKSSLKISPILVILAVVVGGAYVGIVGMFLAVPVVVIIKQILLEYISSREQGELDGSRQ